MSNQLVEKANILNSNDLQSESLPIPASQETGKQPSPNAAADLSPLENTVVDASITQDYVRRAKLMMVDDEPVNIMAVEKHLRGIGYEKFVKTTDSLKAFALIREQEPDLLLLDIMMPELNGLELLRQIRSDVRWQHLPVIILTAYCDPDTKREALEAGATDFLAKPVDSHELALRVRNVLVAKAFYDHVARRAEELEDVVRQQNDELATARHDAELRYMAGKAEIATDVLHNVGNALQSVNTGVNLISYTVRESHIASLKRAVELLQQHDDNLSRFLTKDERGKILPSYLVELTDALLADHDKIRGEIEMLTKHLDHINAVVATQQKYAKLCNISEEVSLPELLGDVEELVGGSFVRHGVNVVRDYRPIAAVNTDRQKLLQVLLNVAKNALESIKQVHKSGNGHLELRCGLMDEQTAFVEVTDNGVGIAQENLIKIFSHGFTTKPDGHGFGLHSCANIMKELDGSLQVYSDGPGRGATFIMQIPISSKGTIS